jgi:hypothetical protein
MVIHRHRQYDVEMLLIESEDDLHPGYPMSQTELNGLRGTEEIHRFRPVTGCDASLFEIKPRIFVLKQNFHGFGVGLISFDQPEADPPLLIVAWSGWCCTNSASFNPSCNVKF